MAKDKNQESQVIEMDADRMKTHLARLKALGIDKSHMKTGSSIKAKQFVLTGQPEIDAILECKEGVGIARGILVEICGLSQSGKTYLALKHMAEYNKLGLRVAFLDVEGTFYKPRFVDLGVQVDNGNLFELYDELSTAEEYGDLAKGLAETGEYGLIVIDSIKALTPEEETDKSLSDKAKLGGHATFIGRMIRKLMPVCSASNTTIILINQFYTASGMIPNTFELAASGGKAVEFFTRMRLWVNRIRGKAGEVIDMVDGVPVRVGGKSRVEIYKSTYHGNGAITEFPIMFGAYEGDPVAEFMYRAMAKGKEYVKPSGRGAKKILRFVDESTGEVLAEAAKPHELVTELCQCPPPSQLTRGDKSTTGFEYICGRLHIPEKQQEQIIARVQSILAGESTASEIDDEVLAEQEES